MEQNSNDRIGLSTNRLQVGRSHRLSSGRGSVGHAARMTQRGAQRSNERESAIGLSSLHTSPSGASAARKTGAAAIIAATDPLSSEYGPQGKKKSRDPFVRVAVGGNFLQLKGGRVQADVVRPYSAVRGCISGFSRGSRRRLMQLLQCVDQSKLLVPLPLFITLTYGKTWPPEPKVWKRQLDTFSKRLARKYPHSVAVWRLEFQKRGAPHYHLIVFNVAYLPHRWVAQAWYEIVGSGDPDHLKAGTEVRSVRSWRGVISYAAKYVSKPQEELSDGVAIPLFVGRWWGVFGRANLPITWRKESLTLGEFYRLRRVLRGFLRSRGVRSSVGVFSGLSVFLSSSAGLRLLQYSGVIQ